MSKISTNRQWLKGRNKYRTGYCLNGHCEGLKPKNHRGKPLRTCHWFLICPCDCHRQVDEMFALAEMPRLLVENPEYVREPVHFIMPSVEELLEARRQRERDEGRELIADADDAEILSGNVFTGTAQGRRNPRQLEYQVLVACLTLAWPRHDIFKLTPKWVSEYIANAEKIAPPSTGAVQAIWDRWVLYDFAYPPLKSPVHFGGFKDTETKPTINTLDLARDKYKHAHRLDQNEKKRVTIRGARK